MPSLNPVLSKRLELASAPSITVAFLVLSVMVQINLQGPVIRPLVLSIVLISCLLLMSFASIRLWKDIGVPGLLILATIASYLVIGSAVSLVADGELQIKDMLRQAFFFIVTLAAILGGRSLVARIGVETLLRRVLMVLSASCAVILASPVLHDIGVLPMYRIATRLTGTFSDPNDAGFIACMTLVLALAFYGNGLQRPLTYLALLLSYAAAFATVSNTAIIAITTILIFFLLSNGLRIRKDFHNHRFITVLLCLGVVISLIYISIATNIHDLVPFQLQKDENTPSTQLQEESTPSTQPQEENTPSNTLARAEEKLGDIRGDRRGGDSALSKRIELWKMGGEIFLESPLFGHGLGSLHSIEGAPLGHDNTPYGVHNLYLTLSGEAGIVPLLLYLASLLFLIRSCWTMKASLARDSIIGWVIALALFGIMFQHLLTMGAYTFLFGLSCALATFLMQERRGSPVHDAQAREASTGADSRAGTA